MKVHVVLLICRLNGNKGLKIVLMFCETSGFCYALFIFWCQLEGFQWAVNLLELLECLCKISEKIIYINLTKSLKVFDHHIWVHVMTCFS